ncbi:hypothetical protein Goarm_022592, partial [Gossypium armourianum]|nr:hypothetical protein [Gossypium armourianum]
EKFDLQGKVEDSDIFSHVAKLRKEFKSTSKTRYYKEMAKKEGREPLRLEQFRFQHFWKDGSDKLSSEVKDSMPTPESFFAPQDNIALENEVYTQVFDPDKDGKMLGYGHGMTKFKLFSYDSVTRGSQSTSAIIEAEERFIKLTEIREAKFMDMMDAREKKHRALFNECMAKEMS